MSTILVTDSAGFIGANLVMRLLRTPYQIGGDDGLTIVGLDNMNDYYDVSLEGVPAAADRCALFDFVVMPGSDRASQIQVRPRKYRR